MREGTATIGWLCAADHPTRAWSGVLLHRDAFLVRAPREVLVEPTKLWVVLADGDADAEGELAGQPSSAEPRPGLRAAEASSRSLPTGSLPVLTAHVLEVDGWADEPAPVMVRLAVDSGVDISTEINRAGFDLAVRVTGDAWQAFESLGLVPDDLYDLRPSADRRELTPRWQEGIRSMTTDGPVRTLPSRAASPRTLATPTVSVGPASWCDIFWWLC